MATMRNGASFGERWRRPPERGVDGSPRSRRLPAPLVAEVERRHGSGVPRQAADRDLQQLERARELQRPPTRAGRVGQARRAAGGRLPARVPGDVARRVVDEADDDAVPESDGDGRRGVDPRLPTRWCRPAHRLRQDEPGQHPRSSEREHPLDRRHRRADAQRALARPRARILLRLLALQRGVPRRPDHRGRVRRDRELDLALERPLHDDGHRLDHGLRDGRARAHADRRRRDPGRRLAPTVTSPSRRGERSSTSSSATSSRATSSPGRRSRTRSASCTRSPVRRTRSSTWSPTRVASASTCHCSCSTTSAARRRGSST